ncbi:sensor histidine kinase [Rheinheimera metallidurans]|uniref:sensor histidine kinase n=1 Tax=Rheinheimera metallidurans TaxID=2925781 RepID=UPI0030016C4E
MTLAAALHFSPLNRKHHNVPDAISDARQPLALFSAPPLDPVLQALPAAVILLDQRGVVYQANPAAIAMLGEPLIDQAWFTVINRCFSPRNDDGLEVSLKDGRRVKLQISALLTHSEYTQSGQLIMLTDLTETRQLQSRLSHLQRLSTLGKMMATLAHQIRTPLSAALLYTQNLANPRTTLQVQQQFQQKLFSRLQDLEQQVNDMLLFARSGSAQQVTVFTLAELTEQLNAGTEALLQQHNASLTLQCPDDSLRLLGNKNALSGAIQNLIQNSIQATAADASITLQFAVSQTDSAMLSIKLTDNGPGISQELRDSLFEPFVTSRAQGTGLGLAVVQAVAHSHHGSVHYLPTAQGACFEMLLPLQQLSTKEYSQ